MASLGKLFLVLRVNKSSDMGIEPCGRVASPLHTQLCYKSVQHTQWASCPELVLQSLPCCQGQMTVSTCPSSCSSRCGCVLATSSKPESQPQGGWERVNERSEGRRCTLESGAVWERGSRAGRSSWVHSALAGGCRMWLLEQRSGSCGAALAEPESFLPSCVAATVTCPGRVQWTQMDLVNGGCVCLVR